MAREDTMASRAWWGIEVWADVYISLGRIFLFIGKGLPVH